MAKLGELLGIFHLLNLPCVHARNELEISERWEHCKCQLLLDVTEDFCIPGNVASDRPGLSKKVGRAGCDCVSLPRPLVYECDRGVTNDSRGHGLSKFFL